MVGPLGPTEIKVIENNILIKHLITFCLVQQTQNLFNKSYVRQPRKYNFIRKFVTKLYPRSSFVITVEEEDLGREVNVPKGDWEG